MYLTDADYEQAAKLGLKEATVYQRVYTYGWEIEDAITRPVTVLGDNKRLIDLAAENGITLNKSTVRYRLDRKWSEADIISTYPHQRRDESHTINKDYLDLAAKNGIKPGTWYHRHYRGWTKEKAATTPTNTHCRRERDR